MKKFMKNSILFILLCFSFWCQAQVGINTTDPKAQLEIKSSSEVTPTNTDGLLIPKVNAFPATNPTIDQQGMLVYLKNASGTNQPGFYYWNFATLIWIPIGNSNSSGWNINGNAGTNASTNFIGTTDFSDVIFKRNNVRAGLLASNNTSFGTFALNPLTTGILNTAIGAFALGSNTTGLYNTATGSGSLALNTTGNFNTANGVSSLALNTNGSNNTATGYESLSSNTLGFHNTANGALALQNNTTGSLNTANGYSALQFNTTGFRNTANGNFSLASNTTGRENTATGTLTLFSNTTGNTNVANGYSVLQFNTTGSSNTANGNSALQLNSTGNFNTANGALSLTSNTIGVGNTANGYESLNSNTSGNSNTANGSNALFLNTSGTLNTANGASALLNNISGSENSSLGFLSDVALNNLNNATAIGARAQVGASDSLVLGSINGVNGATASVNVGIGTTTPLSKLHVVGNIRMVDGNEATGKVLTSDTNGTATWQAIPSANAWGLTGNSGTNPTTNFIGTTDNQSLIFQSNNTNRMAITGAGEVGIGTLVPSERLDVGVGNIAVAGGDIYLGATNGVLNAGGGLMTGLINYIGDAFVAPTQANGDEDLYIADDIELGGQGYKPGGGAWVAPSDRRLKKNIKPYTDGLESLLRINPVTYKYNSTFKTLDTGATYVGVIAQEVKEIAPYMINEKPFGQLVEEDEKGNEKIVNQGTPYLTFDGSALTYMLINAIKEMNVKNEELKNKNEQLENKLNLLLNRIEQLESK